MTERRVKLSMKMRLKDGKLKVITLSYDDGTIQDVRLMEIMKKYGLKGTFNINSGGYMPEDGVRDGVYCKLKLSQAKELYINSGNEIAVHSFTHPHLEKLDTAEIIYEITEDRKAIERDYGVIARGMAYPFGTYNDKVIDVIDKCHIAYARTVFDTHQFDLPENWLTLHPTCRHRDERLFELITNFLEEPNNYKIPRMFYLWGHSYEFDFDDNWEIIEKFGHIAGGRDDIWYATNIEVYDYVKAYERLQTSFDKKIIHNPSAVDVWVDIKSEVYCIKAGKTLYL